MPDDAVEPEVLWGRDDEAHRYERMGEDAALAEQRAAIARDIRQASEDADEAAALVEVIEEIGEVGIEAALTPKDDNLNLIRAGLVALLDYTRGGAGRSPLDGRQGKRKRGRRG
jgi:hypothetical protein